MKMNYWDIEEQAKMSSHRKSEDSEQAQCLSKYIYIYDDDMSVTASWMRMSMQSQIMSNELQTSCALDIVNLWSKKYIYSWPWWHPSLKSCWIHTTQCESPSKPSFGPLMKLCCISSRCSSACCDNPVPSHTDAYIIKTAHNDLITISESF